MVYKKGPPFKVRPVQEICEDMEEARRIHGSGVRTLFFPAGNTIAMTTEDLAAICGSAKMIFPNLDRITVYGSSQYIAKKGLDGLKRLKEAGLSRIHVGFESGDDETLRRVKKGTTVSEQIRAGQYVKEAGIELSEYVVLGLGGQDRSEAHALATAKAMNTIEPDFLRLRTLVPKINTLLLHQIKKGRFALLSSHQVLMETRLLLENITGQMVLTSDHYTNYLNLSGRLPDDRKRLLEEIEEALTWDQNSFRPLFVGTQ
jgi:radical SAM superfamily enzyme YgiQ (UPF0313 family)